jgi:hypothetical protein
MPDISNTFLQGIMNKDLDERLIPTGVYIDALNITVDTADNGNIGAAKNQLGNTNVANLSTISGVQNITNARTIGAVSSEKDNLIYWLVACDQFDAIFEYNQTNGASTRVLQCMKSTPTTPSKLNFNQEFIVTGINYVNGFLYWTDNYNPPRRINISRVKSGPNGIGGYTIDDPRIDNDINVILAPPLHSPKIKLELDGSQSNNIEEKFIYFTYRYKYVDNQYSAMSPFSSVAFKPKDYMLDYNIGNNKSMVNRYNRAKITVFTGNEFVKEIQVLMIDTRALNVYIVDTIKKQSLNIANSVFYEIVFSNNKTYNIVTYDQVTRLFDNVPLFAKAQEFVGNRIMYGNYTQFFDIVDPVRIGLNYNSIVNPNPGEPIQTFRSDRDYEVGIVYLDNYGRSTTTLTSQDNTIYIPPSQSDKGNSLVANIYNTPPTWATNYRLVIKQSKGNYYNLFPIYFYNKSQFRYFLIHESDRDKVPVGKYVIFKSDASGPTYSNKRYKVLELNMQPEGFEGITGAQAGLYFKIKVDSPTELNSNAGVQIYWMDSYSRGDVSFFSPPPPPSLLNNPNLPTPDTSIVENPIYYGENNANALSLSAPPTPMLFSSSFPLLPNDYRITVQVINNNKFRWTLDISSSGQWNGDYNISLGTPFPINIGSQYGQYFYIIWNSQPSVGDIWKINVRSPYTSPTSLNYFGGLGVNNKQAPRCALTLNVGLDQIIYPGDIIEIKYNELQNPNANNKIQTFFSNGTYENIEEWFVESGAYLDFEYMDSNGNDLGSKAVSFRRGTSLYTDTTNPFGPITYLDLDSQNPNFLNYPVYMVITGDQNLYGFLWNGVPANRMSASIYVRHLTNQIIAETVTEDSETDIYHELSRTFKIKNGMHKVRWSYSDYTYVSTGVNTGKTNLGQLIPNSSPLSTDEMHNFIVGEIIHVSSSAFSGLYEILEVNNPYNIVIDLNFPGVGPVTPGTVSYDQIDNDQTSLQSAVIKINNPLRTINSDFNAWSYSNGLETYRIRDDWNAATLKYSPRATSTVDGYEQKVSKNAICYSGIYGENTGINSLNEFNLSIANFKYLDGEFGSIQKLHARDTDIVVFQENKVSSVLYGKNLLSDSVGGGQIVSIPEVLGTQVAFPGEYGISKNPESFAMWGDDIFFTDSNRGAVLQMAGSQIVEISANGMKDYFIDMMQNYGNTQKIGCYDPHNHLYTLSSNNLSILGCKLSINKKEITIGVNGTFTNLVEFFKISTESPWTISVTNLGFGTNWVSGFITSGTGDAVISGQVSQNTTNAIRSMGIVVNYCGKTETFVVKQGRSRKLNVVTVVRNNKI